MSKFPHVKNLSDTYQASKREVFRFKKKMLEDLKKEVESNNPIHVRASTCINIMVNTVSAIGN
jgi:hypothetical protein